MAKFICRNCSYRFETDHSKCSCPYCNTGCFEREKSADELLNEVVSIDLK